MSVELFEEHLFGREYEDCEKDTPFQLDCEQIFERKLSRYIATETPNEIDSNYNISEYDSPPIEEDLFPNDDQEYLFKRRKYIQNNTFPIGQLPPSPILNQIDITSDQHHPNPSNHNVSDFHPPKHHISPETPPQQPQQISHNISLPRSPLSSSPIPSNPQSFSNSEEEWVDNFTKIKTFKDQVSFLHPTSLGVHSHKCFWYPENK